MGLLSKLKKKSIGTKALNKSPVVSRLAKRDAVAKAVGIGKKPTMSAPLPPAATERAGRGERVSRASSAVNPNLDRLRPRGPRR